MKFIIKIISIAIIILTLSEGLSGQITTNTTNTTTPTNTNTTTNATLTNTTSNTTTNTTTNTTQPEIPVKPVIPVKVETDPYKLYLCDEKNSSSISIVNKSF